MQNNLYWVGHRQRLRERAESEGLENLRPYEVIELILFYAVPRQDMTETARNLVNTFGSVEGVLHAEPGQLMRVPGITRGMVEWLQVTRELVDAYLPLCGAGRTRVFRYCDVLQYLLPRWRAVRPPECWMIYTDFDDQVITHSVICHSLAWNAKSCLREIVREAVSSEARHAVLIMFVGTQPLEIEWDEVEEIMRFGRTLHAVEVELLDCVLVNESGFYSLAKHGKMERTLIDNAQRAVFERYTRDDAEAGTGEQSVPSPEEII